MASQQPYESELFGDVAAAGSKLTRFGYKWRERTYGHVAVKIEWDDKGICLLVAEPVTTIDHPIFKERYVSSQTVSWFKLKLGEYFTQLRFRESASGTRITALSFQTNMRRSQWYGSAEGTERTTTAPPEFYIHTIHGSHQGGVCWNLGAYFVPLSLRVTTIREVRDPCDRRQLQGAAILDPLMQQQYLAVTKPPLGPGRNVVVLADDELVTALRACVVNDRVSAIQFQTTLGSTEWFGHRPGPRDVVETRSMTRDEPTATHISGIVGMHGPDHIKSIGVEFYKQS